MITWIMITMIVLLIIAGIVVSIAYKNKGKKHEPDYYTFFVMGITWVPLGIVLNMPVFFIMGLSFMALGLANKDKWKKNHKNLSKLDPKQRKIIIISLILGIILLLGIVVYTLLLKRGIL